jgi:hypothetical protein
MSSSLKIQSSDALSVYAVFQADQVAPIKEFMSPEMFSKKLVHLWPERMNVQ